MHHLKLTKVEGGDLTFQNGLIIQPVRGGLSKVRLDIVGSPTVTSVQLQLNPKEYNQWSYFYRYLIKYGSEKFTADFIVDSWLVEKQVVQMIGGPTVSFIGLTAYVSFNIEVVRKETNDEYLAEVIYAYGDEETVSLIANQLENVANNLFIDN